MSSPFVGAYWKARKESLDICTDRCLSYLERLSVHDNLSTWFKLGKSKKSATKHPIRLAREDIMSNMRTINQDLGERAPIVDLGFRFTAWNGNFSEPADVSVTCGGYSQFVGNAVVLTLPLIKEVDATALELMRDVLSSAVEAWDPDFAIAISSASLTQQGGKIANATGWVNYRRGQGITSI